MKVECCPGSVVLQRYLLGLVEENEQREVEAHLNRCPVCLEALGKISVDDTLVAEIRTSVALSNSTQNATIDRIISQVADRNDQTRVAGSEPPSCDPREFLTPPQQADEIGRLGAFRVLRVLGRGGMGVVFLAEDTALQRAVALKVLNPEFARRADGAVRFLREARAAAALRHEHVVTIYQVGEAEGPEGPVPFLAMEFLEGSSLEKALAQHTLPLSEVIRIGREVAQGLAAAHQSGLIHRDIKPDNIWLEQTQNVAWRSDTTAMQTHECVVPRVDKESVATESTSELLPESGLGHVKLLDFGLARTVRMESQLTEHGVVVGTPAYMAPEQAAGRPIDGRADLFSLGCVLYRMCTGQSPFPTTDVMATLSALANHDPVPVRQLNPAVPQGLADLIHRLLEKNPARRPASAQAVADALRALERKSSALPRPPFLRHSRILLASLAVSLFLVLAAVVIVVRVPGREAEFVIDTDDPNLVFQADGKGGIVLEDRKANRRYQLKVGRYDSATGEYEIDVTEPVGGLEFSTRTLTLKRGDRVALKASLRSAEKATTPDKPEKPGALPAGVTGIDKEWLAMVARLPADEQIVVVTARLRALNPGFDGEVKSEIEAGVVVGFEFPTQDVSNVAPVRGFPGLRKLKCEGTFDDPGDLIDLTPLTGLPLKVLSVFKNDRLFDLRPLAGMPLVELNCYGTAVVDLTPLEKCPLAGLTMGQTGVTNRGLDLVKKLPLKQLNINDSKIDDLRPLAGLKLTNLECGGCPTLKDLSPLKNMPLEYLDITRTAVTDLTPIKNAPLRKLRALGINLAPHRALLQAIPTLETINHMSRHEFWAMEDAKKPDK